MPDLSTLLNWLPGSVIGWLMTIGGVILLIALATHAVLSLLLIIPTWRICRRAGFSGALALLHLLPVVGPLTVMAILAFSDWPGGEARR